MSLEKAPYLGGMKNIRWMALLPLLAAVASACDDFGLAPDTPQQGKLTWTLDGDMLTKADAELPDTNDFLLTISDAGGTILYDGTYGDSPEFLSVEPGSYTLCIRSIAFSAPAFSRPQYGDEQVVLIPAGETVNVSLRCVLLNAGMRLKISADFLSAFPDGELFLKQEQTMLKYLYNEKRTAYLKPDQVSLVLYNEGKDQTLLSRRLQAREILNLGIQLAQSGGQGQLQVLVDTSKIWTQDNFVIGGDNDSDDEQGRPDAISVSDVSKYIDQKGVWVYGYIVGGDLSSAGKSVKTSGITKATHLALADRSSITTKASCLAVELPKGALRDALNLVDHPELIGKRVYVKGDLVSGYFGTRGMKNTKEYVLQQGME